MRKITVVGLGPGDPSHLTMAALEAIKSHSMVYLRTLHHPTVEVLKEYSIQSFDHLYETLEDFDHVYQQIAETLVTAALEQDVLYGVPGHPFVAENSVQKLLTLAKERGIQVVVHPAMSFIDVMLPAVGLDPVEGFKLIDGLQMDQQEPDPNTATIITQVYDPFIASQVKLRLMDYYQDEQLIKVVQNAGIPGKERIVEIPLYELDRLDWVDYLTSVYIPRIDSNEKKYYNMNNLMEIMERLRSKDGCPWDMAQTHESLKHHLIEETYEVLEALDLEDDVLLEEELGDLLLQVVFHSQLAKERQVFTMHDVIHGITEKLIRRHPHVFKGIKAKDGEAALGLWEEQKSIEKQRTTYTQSMESIPKHLPALMRAYKIQKKAQTVGFDWDKLEDVVGKVDEELAELKEAIQQGKAQEMIGEGGDLLFAVVNLLRFLNIQPEEALNQTNRKFIQRFSYMEQQAKGMGKDLKSMKLEEMDVLWEAAKRDHT